MGVLLVRGDARNLPLADACVDLVVTSPPFYALRSYTDGGEHYDGQIGSEKTPAEYVDNLVACTREWVRVLKPSGSLWVNLGDSYSGAPAGPQGASGQRAGRSNANEPNRAAARRQADVRAKSLRGLPWRYALRCIDELGLILRAEVIWSKPNGLPESVTDRVRRSHEQWFHFVRSPRYYSAVDTIRQPHARAYTARDYESYVARANKRPGTQGFTGGKGTLRPDAAANPLGALPGSVWTISTQPLTVPAHLDVDHFAAFPMEWPRRIVQGWSPSGVCTGCGEGRRPTSESEKHPTQRTHNGYTRGALFDRQYGFSEVPHRKLTTITGERCACSDTSAPTRPAVVLDPFGGTGTTALVAAVLGRVGVSVDMSADYCRLAQWRTADPGERAAAMVVPRPERPVSGQDSLFDMEGFGG